VALRSRPCGGWRQTAPMLRWLKTVVASVRGKAGLDPVRWGPGRRSRMRSKPGLVWGLGRALLRRRKGLDGIKIGGPASSSETSLAGSRVPGQVVPGVEAA
jgi:hypothetical protein